MTGAHVTGAHEMTAEDVSAFLDGLMPQQLAREDTAGAVISVVKDGKVLFAKVSTGSACGQTGIPHYEYRS